MIASRRVDMVRHPRGSYSVIPIAASGVGTPENKVNHWRCHPQARKQAHGAEVRLRSGSWKDAVYPSRDTPNTSRRFAHGASNVCLVGATRRAPCRPVRDARGHTATAMHTLSTHSPSPAKMLYLVLHLLRAW